MTTEQKLSMLESLCERVYEMGKDILDPNVKDAKKKIVAMTQVAGAFALFVVANLREINSKIDSIS